MLESTGAAISTTSGTAVKFADVKSGDWHNDAVTWAADRGIVTGSPRSDGTALFHPDDKISRQDMAVILNKYLVNVEKKTLTEQGAKVIFTDRGKIADYAKTAVETMQTGGIISGEKTADGSFCFKPEDNAARAEAASMLAKLFQL